MNNYELLRASLAPEYQIERELGRGGMAIVFLAHERKHDRAVAIKLLRPELTADLGAERFLREIKIAARLSHPNIVPLLASGQAGPLLYYVMPFIEGDSLRARLDREGRLSVPAALRIARQVASALTYAHTHGVVHRDIKPENIMLSGDAAMVSDFGIATALEQAGSSRLTQTGVSIGTPIYMSPEQAGGTADGRSDVYSLACVVVEMLTSHPPYTGPTALSILARHATEPAPSVSAIRPEVSAAVEQALVRALSKTPDARYATPDEFVAAFEAPGTAAAPRAAALDSIAVLPFTDLSRARDQEYLCDGIATELLDALMRLGTLRVASRTSAFAFKGQSVDVREVGRRLGVRSVLEGNVRVAGDALRISVTLTSAETGFQLWSERYDRSMTDVFVVQDEIARRVVDRLAPQVADYGAGAPVVAPGTADVEAYRAYLRGRHFADRRTAQDLERAIAAYESALAREPGFALAAAGLADAWFLLPAYGARSPDDAMPSARAAAQRAMSSGHESTEALAVQASVRAVFEWDWTGADTDFRRALSLSPGNPTVLHRYAVNCLLPQRRFAEGLARLEEALQQDPMSLPAATSLGLLHYLERRTAAAIASYHSVLELDSGFTLARYLEGVALLETDTPADAVPPLEAACAAGRSAESLAALAAAYATVDRRDDALRLQAELETMAGTRYVSPVLLAQVYLALRQPERAFQELERACEGHASELAWLAVRPTWAPLRNAARFQDLLRRVGLA